MVVFSSLQTHWSKGSTQWRMTFGIHIYIFHRGWDEPSSLQKKARVCCAVLSCSVMSDSLQPHGLQPARLLCPWGFSRKEYWSGLPFPSPGDLPNPGIKPRSPTLQADSLSVEPQKSPRILEWVAFPFSRGSAPTQESNRGLLHCRRIL